MVLKRSLITILSILLCFSTPPSFARECETIQDHATNTDALYRTGCGAIDGAYTATSTTMLGWGIALFIAIALITGTIHQSKSKHISTQTNTSTSSSSSSSDTQ